MIKVSVMRASGQRPRVHGNGFIQYDFDDVNRLHIWGDPRIPRQNVATPIHDHIFSFTSRIIVGRLINISYIHEMRTFGDYRVFTPEVREGEDTILVPTESRVTVSPIHVDVVGVNNRHTDYKMQAGVFHETIAPDGPAATMIRKRGKTQAQGGAGKPHVLVPWGVEPDNEFNRYDADEDLLWQIIEDVVGAK